MVDAGAVVLLVLCVQEPELSLKRVAASALSDIAKHTPELAQAVVDAGLSHHTIHCCCLHHGANDSADLQGNMPHSTTSLIATRMHCTSCSSAVIMHLCKRA